MRRLVGIVLVLAAIAALLYVVARRPSFGTTFQRVPTIDDIAWGKDGSLYVRVHWVIIEQMGGGRIRPVHSFKEDAVYRLDPREKVIRRLPMAEASRIVERWPNQDTSGWWQGEPAHGWIGARYRVVSKWTRGPMMQRSISAETEVIRNQYIFDGICLDDFDAGKSEELPTIEIQRHMGDRRISVPARLAPDDNYVVYVDGATLQTVIRWLPEGIEAPIPCATIGAESNSAVGLPYPTTQGLLFPARRLLLDPVTFDTRVGWDPFMGLVPGQLALLNPEGDYVAGFRGPRLGTSPRRADRARTISFAFPTGSVDNNLPEAWRNLDEYPIEYPLGGEP